MVNITINENGSTKKNNSTSGNDFVYPVDELPRKMIRVSPEVHAMAKKAAALRDMHMQSYIEELIHKDFKSNYPKFWKRIMDSIRLKYPNHYENVISKFKTK